MAGFKKLGTKGNVVHHVVLPGPTRRAGARRAGASGSGLRGLNLDRARQGSPVAGPAPQPTGSQPSGTPAARRTTNGNSPAQPSPAEARQSKRETDLLQRRIEKLSRLLTEQEEQIRTLAERDQVEEVVTPLYGAVKPQLPTTAPDEKRRAFMSQLFQANLELRESVNKTGS
jgi:hypothetical protein